MSRIHQVYVLPCKIPNRRRGQGRVKTVKNTERGGDEGGPVERVNPGRFSIWICGIRKQDKKYWWANVSVYITTQNTHSWHQTIVWTQQCKISRRCLCHCPHPCVVDALIGSWTNLVLIWLCLNVFMFADFFHGWSLFNLLKITFLRARQWSHLWLLVYQ